MSKDATAFAGIRHKKWIAQSGPAPSSGGKGVSGSTEDGGLFFTEDTHEKPKGLGGRPLTPGPNCGNSVPRRSSISLFAPVTAMTRRSSWRQVSETNGSSVMTHNPAIVEALKAAAENTIGVQDDGKAAHALKVSAHMLEHDEHISRENFFKVRSHNTLQLHYLYVHVFRLIDL